MKSVALVSHKKLPTAKARFHEAMLYLMSHPGPFVMAGMLRQIGDFSYIPGVGYIVSNPILINAMLKDSDTFTKNAPGGTGLLTTQVIGANALINLDGAEHAMLRSRFADIFSARTVTPMVHKAIEPSITLLKERLEFGSAVDLVEFAHELTGRVTCEILGIDIEGNAGGVTHANLQHIVESIIAPMSLSKRRFSSKHAREAQSHVSKIAELARESYQRLPPDSQTVIGRLKSQGFGFEEIRGLMVVLVMVGVESVSSALPRTVALLCDTGQINLLRDQPELVPNAIDEALRYTVPLPLLTRGITENAVILGRRFKRGRRAVLFLYNAMKNPKYFEHPSRFDITREIPHEVKHLWFGAGPHFCLGFGVAQIEIRSVLQAILETSSDVRIVKRRYALGATIPAYSRLEIQSRSS